MKKYLSLVSIALAVIVSVLTLTVFAADASFTDIEGHWSYDFVNTAYERGYVTGRPGNIYDPDGSVTRAECVTILARLCGAEQDTASTFNDVSESDWYIGYVGWAVRAGITVGYPEDNTFRGDNPVTREELMVMLSRYLNYVWADLSTVETTTAAFNDEGDISDWAFDYVYKMRDLGIVKGDSAGCFNPQSSTNRAEMATITVRLGDAIDRYEPNSSVAGNALTSYSLYSNKLNASQLSDVAAVIKSKTGVELASVSAKPTGNYINFTVDESLKMLQYTITEENGVLTFKVSSDYAVAYFADIVTDALSKRDDFTVPAGFKGEGFYTLDEATNKSEINFKCETDKNPLAYEVGDKVTFRVSIIQDGKLVSVPQFSYTYSPDYGTPETALVPGHAGQFVITKDGLDKPGSAFLQVHLANRKGVKIASLDAEMKASVIFDFYNLDVSYEKPSDFDSFWDGKMEELMTVEPTAISSVPCPAYSSSTHDTYCVEIQSLGTVAYGHVTVPKNAAKGSLPIYVSYTPYGDIGSDVPQYGSCIFVTVNRHEIKNHLSAAEYKAYETAIGQWGFDNPTREESFFMGNLMRDVQILRYAEKEFADLWNGRDITLTGGSFGGFQSIAVAGLYDKVTRIELSFPWLSDIGGIDIGRYRSVFMPDYNNGSKYFDTCYFAERFDGSVYLYVGLGDDCCPSYGLVALYNSFSGNKSMTANQCGGHGPSGGPYNGYFYVVNDGAIDPINSEIKDNGCAVPAPNYSPDRTLNESELAMKAVTDSYTSKVKLLKKTCTNSTELDKADFETMIKDALVTKCGLDSSYTIVVDEDYFEAVLREGVRNGSGSVYMVEYTVYDNNGGYVDAVARFMITKS